MEELKFIDIGTNPTDETLFKADPHYPYTFFVRLMKKLEAQSMEKKFCFWFSRNIILRHVNELVIVIDKNNEIVAFYIIREGGEIEFLEVFEPGNGVGRKIIERELSKGKHLFVAVALPESTGFWNRMGIVYDHVTGKC